MVTIFKAILSNQIFYYTRCTTPKRVTSLWGPSPSHCARDYSSFRRNIPAVMSRYVRFDWPEIGTSNLPLQRRTRYRSTNLKQKLFPFWHCKHWLIRKSEYGAEPVETAEVRKKKLNSKIL